MPISLTQTQLFTNNAVSLLAAPITDTDTSFRVMDGYGELFPNPGPNEFFLVTLENQTGTIREIIKINNRVSDVFNFTLSDRGLEGTAPQNWGASIGNDTLVDHRVTAETMRRAMSLPISPEQGINIQQNGGPVSPNVKTLNFVGDIELTGIGDAKTITLLNSSGGSSDIHGQSGNIINIDPGWTIAGSTSTYSEYQRGFKFFVTITMPANHLSCSFEVLGNISGNLDANDEIVHFNTTSRVGRKFQGSVNIVLDKNTKQISLVWTNNEIYAVRMQCIRIQHLS
jgi:hypothetical protein